VIDVFAKDEVANYVEIDPGDFGLKDVEPTDPPRKLQPAIFACG